jgi:hypothetical protein
MKKIVRNYLPYEIRELGWAIAEGKTDEYSFQVRFRCFPFDFPKESYPVASTCSGKWHNLLKMAWPRRSIYR